MGLLFAAVYHRQIHCFHLSVAVLVAVPLHLEDFQRGLIDQKTLYTNGAGERI